jgi:hypothetical protein
VDILVPLGQLTKTVKCSSPKEDIGIVPESKDKVKLRCNIAGNTVEQTISTAQKIKTISTGAWLQKQIAWLPASEPLAA